MQIQVQIWFKHKCKEKMRKWEMFCVLNETVICVYVFDVYYIVYFLPLTLIVYNIMDNSNPVWLLYVCRRSTRPLSHICGMVLHLYYKHRETPFSYTIPNSFMSVRVVPAANTRCASAAWITLQPTLMVTSFFSSFKCSLLHVSAWLNTI